MTEPKFCKDCKYVFTKETWSSLRCKHPQVNSADPWALAYLDFSGTECRSEREKTWFAKCGIKGKLYEPK